MAKAFRATLEYRERVLDPSVFEKIAEFVHDDFLRMRWKAFEPAKDTGLIFEETLERMKIFLKPVFESVVLKINFQKKWNCGMKEWI